MFHPPARHNIARHATVRAIGNRQLTTRVRYIKRSTVQRPHILGGQQALDRMVCGASVQHLSDPGRTAVAGTTAAADPRHASSDALIKAVVICEETFPNAHLAWEVCTYGHSQCLTCIEVHPSSCGVSNIAERLLACVVGLLQRVQNSFT